MKNRKYTVGRNEPLNQSNSADIFDTSKGIGTGGEGFIPVGIEPVFTPAASNAQRKLGLSAGDRIAKWRLIESLGKGGNGQVWRAAQEDGTEVALKILFIQQINSYPYRRFVAEINLLSQLGNHQGILPIIDSQLPEEPNIENPACFSMPIATPLSKVLKVGVAVSDVVKAVATFAETLAALSEKGISHRDIKPDNLYQYNGEWVIGDFGIAEYPDKEALTKEGRKLGPQHFLAPEMLEHPDTADGSLADVYSLSKTLWVLATGQNFPPPGEISPDSKGMRIRDYVQDKKTQLLDRLIERTTKHNPENRPSMIEVASELRAYLAPQAKTVLPEDFTDIRNRIANAIEPALRTKKQLEKWIMEGEDALEDIENKSLSRIQGKIARATHSTGDIISDDFAFELFGTPSYIGSPDVIWKMGKCIYAYFEKGYWVQYTCAIGVEVLDNETLHLVAAHVVQMRDIQPNVVWHHNQIVPLGSATQSQAINQLVNGLIENTRAAIEKYAEYIERLGE